MRKKGERGRAGTGLTRERTGGVGGNTNRHQLVGRGGGGLGRVQWRVENGVQLDS